GPFDAALNLWTSLGYYDEETDIRILQEYGKLVRPGGILVVYIVNRDFVVRHFEPQGYEAFGDLVHIEQRHLDLVTSRMRNVWRFFRRNGEGLDHVLTLPIEHCIYSLHELRRLLVRGGWLPIEAFGGVKMEGPVIDDVDAPGLRRMGASHRHRGCAPRTEDRIAGVHPRRRNLLLGPRAGSGVHGGRCRLPSSLQGACSARREADLRLPEPRLLRI